MNSRKKQFDIALSFAGEDRAYVEDVARWLTRMGYKVFYDKYETATLWGKDLYSYLMDVYRKKARYTVMFCSRHYARKLWTNLERRAAQARAFKSSKAYILPARFDNTEIPGLLPTIGYVDLKQFPPKKLALIIKQKVGKVPRRMFFPQDPDLLFKSLKATKKKEKEIVVNSAAYFWRSLSLMTVDERKLLKIAVDNTCPCGPPKNVHLNLEYLARLAEMSPAEVLSKFARLDCVGIEAKVKKQNASDDQICSSRETIELRYCPLTDECPRNATFVVIEIFEILSANLCPDCRVVALESLDFSFLSSLAGFPDYQSSPMKAENAPR